MSTVGPSNTINEQYNGRLDYQLTDKDLLAYDIYYVPVNSTSYNGAQRASNLFYHNALNYSTGLLYNHTFSPTLLNEARGDYAGWKWNELADNPQSPLGLPNDYIALNNGVSFSNVTFNGGNGPADFGPSIGSIFDQWTLNFKDVLTKVYKSHNLKFGGQYTRLAYLDSATWAASQNFYFNNYWDFLNDAPTTETVSGADPTTGIPTMSRKDDRQYIPSVFVQDDWKVRPNLTLNLGLRWEYFAGMTEKNGNNPRLNLGRGPATVHEPGHRAEPASGRCAEGQLWAGIWLCMEPGAGWRQTGAARWLRHELQWTGAGDHHQHALRSAVPDQQQYSDGLGDRLWHRFQHLPIWSVTRQSCADFNIQLGKPAYRRRCCRHYRNR